MKFYAAVAACLLLIVAAQADDMTNMLGSSSGSSGGSYGGSSGGSYSGSSAGSYGGSSMAALPCPKNYMFSCQPSLRPAPCSHASYGSTGAYSSNYPIYAIPLAQYLNSANGVQAY